MNNHNLLLSEVGVAPTVTLNNNIQHISPQSVAPVFAFSELPLQSVVQPPLPSVTQHNAQGTQTRSAFPATVAPSIDPTSFKSPPTRRNNDTDTTSQLVKAVVAASERPKRPELVQFSGDLGQWMSFKTSYDKTNNISPQPKKFDSLEQFHSRPSISSRRFSPLGFEQPRDRHGRATAKLRPA